MGLARLEIFTEECVFCLDQLSFLPRNIRRPDPARLKLAHVHVEEDIAGALTVVAWLGLI